MTEHDPERRKHRTSITKLQRQTSVAADLIALCQTVTEDGHLEDQEVLALRQWLDENRNTNLPAIAVLLESVERILADGKVTETERGELYRMIETILPPDIRESVRGKRLSKERVSRVEAQQKREAAKQAEREARVRNSPIDKWDFMVAGVRYEGRPEVISRYAESGDAAVLARDRNNRFSRNAIEVRLSNGMQVGYVPEEHAMEIAPLLDGGHKHSAYIKKILTGGRSPIPVVVVSIFLPDADIPEGVLPPRILTSRRLPPSPTTIASGKGGCLLVLGVIFGVVGMAAWWLLIYAT